MKRKTVLSLSLIFALIFTAVPMTVFAATDLYIAEAFPDANFRAYVEINFDTDGNGYLSLGEIERATGINAADSEIKTLKGIEFLTELKTLSCRGNQLSTLDVRMNTKLENLYCDGNQLTTLDVSNNTVLKNLDCRSNQLTALNVSRNAELQNLICSGNKLITLDVRMNTKLENLYCDGNQLTTLNVSNNAALEKLSCYSNELDALNVSNSTMLTELDCRSNQLTALNVSKNTALTELYCNHNQLTTLDVSKNTALTELMCNSNQLTTLNVSQSTDLSSLYCFSNQLTTLDISKSTKLTALYCYYNPLTSLDVNKNTALKTLDSDYCQLTKLDVSKNTKLAKLSCRGNQITSLDLSKNTALKDLRISPKLYIRGKSNGDLYIDLNQVAKYVTLPKHFKLSEGTEVSAEFGTLEGSDTQIFEAAFDVATLIATWGTGQLGEYKNCIDGSWYNADNGCRLSFDVNQGVDLPAPVVTKGNDPVTGKPKLTWKAVSGAAKYEVYRYDSVKKVYVKMYTTTGTTYTNTLSSEAGKTYYYKVKAIGSSSSMTPSITGPITITCKYPTPVVTGSNDPVTGRNVLNWKKVDGATKYEVYRYDKVKKVYVKMYTTTGTTYANTIATVGETYFYKVKALGPVAAATSAFSKPVTLTYKCATPVLTGSNDPVTGRNVLNWKKVDGATKYEVYRYDKVKKVYVKMYTTTGTTYANTIATVGETYFYKVKALGPVAAATSAFSKPVTLTYKCATPVVMGSTNPSTGKPKLTWDKVTGATKYEVYRYDSAKKEYVKYYTTTDTFFNNLSAQTGVTYYYKVKALGATTAANSALSTQIKITCK